MRLFQADILLPGAWSLSLQFRGQFTYIQLSKLSPESVPRIAQRPLPGGDLNRSIQHLDSKYREEDVADEAETEDLLQLSAEEPDVRIGVEPRFSNSVKPYY